MFYFNSSWKGWLWMGVGVENVHPFKKKGGGLSGWKLYINSKRLDDCSSKQKSLTQDKVVRGAKTNVRLLKELGRQCVEEGEPKELSTCSYGGGWNRRN